MRSIRRTLVAFFAVCLLSVGVTACKDTQETDAESTTTETIQNGIVSDASAFESLGLVIDVAASDLVTDVSYEITEDEIACVRFVYNGLECEFRGSAVYSDFELAGISDATPDDMILSTIGGYSATIYSLDPGRIVFWEDTHIHYCLYVYVTAEDSVVNSILSLLSYEDWYYTRSDVIADREAAARAFAEQIVAAVQNRDIQAFADLMNYPQEMGDGTAVNSKNDLLSIQTDTLFTADLVAAVNEAALDNLRAGSDDDAYLIGSSTKNIYFRLTDESTYKIIKVNN